MQPNQAPKTEQQQKSQPPSKMREELDYGTDSAKKVFESLGYKPTDLNSRAVMGTEKAIRNGGRYYNDLTKKDALDDMVGRSMLEDAAKDKYKPIPRLALRMDTPDGRFAAEIIGEPAVRGKANTGGGIKLTVTDKTGGSDVPYHMSQGQNDKYMELYIFGDKLYGATVVATPGAKEITPKPPSKELVKVAEQFMEPYRPKLQP